MAQLQVSIDNFLMTIEIPSREIEFTVKKDLKKSQTQQVENKEQSTQGYEEAEVRIKPRCSRHSKAQIKSWKRCNQSQTRQENYTEDRIIPKCKRGECYDMICAQLEICNDYGEAKVRIKPRCSRHSKAQIKSWKRCNQSQTRQENYTEDRIIPKCERGKCDDMNYAQLKRYNCRVKKMKNLRRYKKYIKEARFFI